MRSARLIAIAAYLMLPSIGTSSIAYANPILRVNSSGILTGALNVSVDGAFYDVSFIDGTVCGVFVPCQTSSLPFQSLASATDASLVLWSEVVVDGPAGNFDSSPNLTAGCSNPAYCEIITPYDINSFPFIQAAFYGNSSGNGSHTYGDQPRPADIDTSSSTSQVWAVWSPAEPVPEPSTWPIMLFGIFGVGNLMRRRARSVKTLTLRQPMTVSSRALGEI